MLRDNKSLQKNWSLNELNSKDTRQKNVNFIENNIYTTILKKKKNRRMRSLSAELFKVFWRENSAHLKIIYFQNQWIKMAHGFFGSLFSKYFLTGILKFLNEMIFSYGWP